MLKAGMYLDMENIMRNGGWGIQYARGVFQYVNEMKGYGFLLSRTGLGPTDFQNNAVNYI